MEKLKFGNFSIEEYRVACFRKNTTNKQVSELLGVSYTTLYRILQNNGNFSRNQIQKLSDYFGPDTVNNFLFSK